MKIATKGKTISNGKTPRTTSNFIGSLLKLHQIVAQAS